MDATVPVEEDPDGFSLRDVLQLLRRRWKAITAFTLLGLAVAAVLTALQPLTYTASATAVVNPTVTDNPAAALSQDSVAKSRAVQFDELAGSALVAERAAAMVDFPVSTGQALSAVTTSVPTNTALIKVQAEWSDPAQAAQLADAWVQALQDQVGELDAADGREPQVQIDRLLPATVPASPTSPNPPLNFVVGAVLGLAAGAALALALEALDRRIRGTDDLQRAGVTPIGAIPKSTGLADGQRVLEPAGRQDAGHFRIREAFNELRINLQYMNPDDPPRIITVTSASPGDGKSTVAANLAVTLARADVPVVLVDADLRKPTVATTFRLPRGAGLSDVVVGRAEFADAIHAPAGFDGLHVVPAGQIPPDPTQLVTSERFKQALEALAETHMVIVDAPPLLAVSDAAVMATRLDGAVLVLNAKSTTRDQVRQALTSLERVHAPVLGAVMNRVEMKGKESRYGYYGGGQDMDTQDGA